MRFHVISLPHTMTTRAHDHCAYTAKVRKFADMMTTRGHDVFLYAGEYNEAACTEHICCIACAEQESLLGRYEWWTNGAIYGVDWNPELPFWQLFNWKAVSEISARIQPRDFVCLITGWSAKPIADAFPGNIVVEFGIGYEGILPTTRHVFESYAWMHAISGMGGPSKADGHFFDSVIPNYYDISEFPGPADPEDYFLFMSRMIPRKGYQIAIETTEKIGAKLKIAGIGGDRPMHDHVEYVGLANTRRRGELMSRARAVFVPTIYVEPFGGVAAEAMLCGTPVITTDWGAFTEYVREGVNGFRCRMMKEFVTATRAVRMLDREKIREEARARFSMERVGLQYEIYFERLATLWEEGFYAGV